VLVQGQEDPDVLDYVPEFREELAAVLDFRELPKFVSFLVGEFLAGLPLLLVEGQF